MTINAKSTSCDIHVDLDLAEQQCQLSGKRLTKKRKQVLEILLKLNRAVSAYEVIEFFCGAHGETLAPTSMYRILEFLEEEHFVHKLKLANKYVACSHIVCCKRHPASQFLICSHCNKVKEIIISPDAFNELKQSSSEVGFEIEQPQLEISCICSQCR